MEGDAELTNDAIYWRGLFVQRYSGIEFGLTHILVAASYHPNFADLGPPPFRLSAKLRSLRALFDRDGPVADHREALSGHLHYFEAMEDTRHFLVHGVMLANRVEGEAMCHFRLYQHREGDFQQGVWTVPLEQFKGHVHEVAQHSIPFGELAAKVARKFSAGAKA